MTPLETRAAIQHLAGLHCRDAATFFDELDRLRQLIEQQESPPGAFAALHYAEKHAHWHFAKLDAVKLGHLRNQQHQYVAKAERVTRLARTIVQKRTAAEEARNLVDLANTIERQIQTHAEHLVTVVINQSFRKVPSAPPPATVPQVRPSKADAEIEAHLTRMSAAPQVLIDLTDLKDYSES